ncbi:MAG: hypothetical protein ACTSP9_13440 [Promethearchaeota archaeon]
MGINYKEMSQTEKPKLFIQGDKDSIARYDNFLSHYNFYKEPKEKIIVKGADHFYGGYERILADEVVKFIKKISSLNG